eukprot:9467758-Pyramimonas_sp.AAC.1
MGTSASNHYPCDASISLLLPACSLLLPLIPPRAHTHTAHTRNQLHTDSVILRLTRAHPHPVFRHTHAQTKLHSGIIRLTDTCSHPHPLPST